MGKYSKCFQEEIGNFVENSGMTQAIYFFVNLLLFAKHCAENAQSEMHFKNSNMEAVADCKERPLM